MNLYFLRHAKAHPRGPKWRPDSKRPLTKEGEKKMVDVARGIKKLGIGFDLILTSPFERALRTAQIVVEVYKVRKLFPTNNLASNADPQAIISEINEMALNAAMTPKDALIHLDAVDGTDNLDVLTVTASFEGPYRNLLAFINSIDKSPHLLLIDSLGATPAQGDKLQVTIKFYTFVKEDPTA